MKNKKDLRCPPRLVKDLAEKELKNAYPSLNWQKGRLMNGATKEEIKQWTKK